ncbi:hypothetical protein, partial [Burkholderia sp. WAC0059]|uniref:hypothetical protein n=1 Tax=Burkholderia sp. WAC0059 TaxID=2066022 RepID=UPI001CA541AA
CHARFGLLQHSHNLLDTKAFAFHRTAPFLRKVRRKLAYIMALFTGGRSQRQPPDHWRSKQEG